MDVDTLRAAIKWQRDNALWELGRIGKCWVCGARTPERLPDGRSRCPGCTGEGYVTKMDGSPFRAPDIPWDSPVPPPPEKTTPLGCLPDWWRTMPACKVEREKQVAAVADGRRPEIDRWVLGVPDKVRAAAAMLRHAAWAVWTVALDGGGVAGRARVLMVAYRGADMVVVPWDQGADLTWKAGRASWWVGRVPNGSDAWTRTAKRMTAAIERAD